MEGFITGIRNKNTSRSRLEENIKDMTMGGDYDLAFMDGIKQEDGKTGAGWTDRNDFYGGRGFSTFIAVWDVEVTAIAEKLRRCKVGRLLILSDSKAAIAVIVKAVLLTMPSHPNSQPLFLICPCSRPSPRPCSLRSASATFC